VFLVSSLAQQAAVARLRGATHLEIVTGNPDTRRDFTDVRDVVRAYRLLADRAPRGVYNVSSGRSISVFDQIEILSDLLAPVRVEHKVDRARFRVGEVMELRGTHDRLTAATGWEPEVPFRQTMADTVAWWEQELSAGAPR
jgi:GDP-4-dehydro-6-deoxy-D-mannose reductase